MASESIYFGYSIFSNSIDEQIEYAVLADRLGFGAVMVGEHIALPAGAPSVYSPQAGSDDKSPTQAAGLPRSVYDEKSKFWDLIAVLAVIARETERISLISAIYLAGLRHPLITATSMATLHELSQGRFQLGLGAGWNKEEYEAVGGNFQDRGPILDETVDVLKAAMHGGPIEHHGRHYSFGPIRLTQPSPSVPILFGGHSPPALRRAARIGDGWISSLYNEVSELADLVNIIERHRQEMGTAERRFDYWAKLTKVDADQISALRSMGIRRFQLIGEGIWGPKDEPFQLRSQRMKKLARELRLD